MFRTEAGLRFCLSKNHSLVRSMLIGRKYRVTGREYTTGHVTYLNMISATLVLSKTALLKKRFGLVTSAASLVIIVGSVSTSFLLHQDEAHNNQTQSSPDALIQSIQDANTPGLTSKIKSIINQPEGATSPKSTPTSTSPEPPAVAPTPPPDPTPTPDPALTPPPDPAPDPTPLPVVSPPPDPTPAPPPEI